MEGDGEMMLVHRPIKAELINDENEKPIYQYHNASYNNTTLSHVDYHEHLSSNIHLVKNINSVPVNNNNNNCTEFSKYTNLHVNQTHCQYSEDDEITAQNTNTRNLPNRCLFYDNVQSQSTNCSNKVITDDINVSSQRGYPEEEAYVSSCHNGISQEPMEDSTCQLKIIAVYSEADLGFNDGEENHIAENGLCENLENVKSEADSSATQQDTFETEGLGVFNLLPNSHASPNKISTIPTLQKNNGKRKYTVVKTKRKKYRSSIESLETMSPEIQFPEVPSPILPPEEMVSPVHPLVETASLDEVPPDNSTKKSSKKYRKAAHDQDHSSSIVSRTRRKKCGVCVPCQVKINCNTCRFCLNRKALKQACIERQCVYLKFKKSAVEQSLQKLIEKEQQVAEAIQAEMKCSGDNQDSVLAEESVLNSSTAYDNSMAVGLEQRASDTSHNENLRPDKVNISATETDRSYANEQSDNLMQSVPGINGSCVPPIAKVLGHSISNSFVQPAEAPNFINSKSLTETLYVEYKKRFDTWFQNTFQNASGISMMLPPPPPPLPELHAPPPELQTTTTIMSHHDIALSSLRYCDPCHPGHPERYSHLYSMWFEHLKAQRSMHSQLSPQSQQLHAMLPPHNAPRLPPPPPQCLMPCCSSSYPASDLPQQVANHSFMPPPTVNSAPRFQHNYHPYHPATDFLLASHAHPGTAQVSTLGTWLPPYPASSSSSIRPSLCPPSIPRHPHLPYHSDFSPMIPQYASPASRDMQDSSFVQPYPDQRFLHEATQSVNLNLLPNEQAFLHQYPRFVPPNVPRTSCYINKIHPNKTHPKVQCSQETNRKCLSPDTSNPPYSASNSSLLNRCPVPQPRSSVQKEKHEQLPLPLSVHGNIKIDDLDINAIVSMDSQNSIKVEIISEKCPVDGSADPIKRTKYSSSKVNHVKSMFRRDVTKIKCNRKKDLALGRTFQIMSNIGVKQVWGIDRTFEFEIPGYNLSVENVELSDDLLNRSSNKDELLSFISIQKNDCEERFGIADEAFEEASTSLDADEPVQHPNSAKHKTEDDKPSSVSAHIDTMSTEKCEDEEAEEEEEEEGEEEEEFLPKLPEDFASGLVEAITEIKERVKDNDLVLEENQIYSAEIDEKLLEIEKKTYQFGPKIRLGIFRHISTYLPGRSEPLYKCVKKIRFNVNQTKLKKSLSNLKETLKQVNLTKTFPEGKCNPEQIFGAGSNAKIRPLLMEAILNKMRMYTVAKSKKQSPERFLWLFLRRLLNDNPQLCALTVDQLYRWSHLVHDPWTNCTMAVANDHPTDGSLMAAKGYYMQIFKLPDTQHIDKDSDLLPNAKHDHNRNNINGNDSCCHSDNTIQLPNGIDRSITKTGGAGEIHAIRNERRSELPAQSGNKKYISKSPGSVKENVSRNVLSSSLSTDAWIRDQNVSAFENNLHGQKSSAHCTQTSVDNKNFNNKNLIKLLQASAMPCPSSFTSVIRSNCDEDVENYIEDVSPTIKKLSRNRHFLLDYLHTLKQSQ